MAADPVYTYIDSETKVEKTISEKQLTEHICNDVEAIFDIYDKKHGFDKPADFEKRDYDRNGMLKVFHIKFEDKAAHIMVFKGFWIHALGMLRLLFGLNDGTRAYLQRTAFNVESWPLYRGHFINFNYLANGLAHYDKDCFPIYCIEKTTQFESRGGLCDLNTACEFCFSNKIMMKKIGSIGSRAGSRAREVLERFSPKVFESGKWRTNMDAWDTETLEKMKKAYRGILNTGIENEIIEDVKDQIKHERERPTNMIKKRQRRQ